LVLTLVYTFLSQTLTLSQTLNQMTQTINVPTVYNLPSPWFFVPRAGLDVYTANFEMCDNPPYANCYVQTRVNIADRKWDYNGGNYVSSSIYSAYDGCTTPIVSNNPSGASPQIADFLYKPTLGSKFFVVMKSGGTAEMTGTLDVKITCDTEVPIEKNFVPRKENLVSCPIPNATMGLSYKLDTPMAVKTNIAEGSDAWLQFKFGLCVPHYYTSMDYFAECTDTNSAIASRICLTGPNCYEQNTFKSDKSASSLNKIHISPLTPNAPLYFSVAGWGAYNTDNKFSVAFYLNRNETFLFR